MSKRITSSAWTLRLRTAVLNSATVLTRVTPMQSRGWRDPRHFDNLDWELPVPEFDRPTSQMISSNPIGGSPEKSRNGAICIRLRGCPTKLGFDLL
jgi:hypothetical protein